MIIIRVCVCVRVNRALLQRWEKRYLQATDRPTDQNQTKTHLKFMILSVSILNKFHQMVYFAFDSSTFRITFYRTQFTASVCHSRYFRYVFVRWIGVYTLNAYSMSCVCNKKNNLRIWILFFIHLICVLLSKYVTKLRLNLVGWSPELNRKRWVRFLWLHSNVVTLQRLQHRSLYYFTIVRCCCAVLWCGLDDHRAIHRYFYSKYFRHVSHCWAIRLNILNDLLINLTTLFQFTWSTRANAVAARLFFLATVAQCRRRCWCWWLLLLLLILKFTKHTTSRIRTLAKPWNAATETYGFSLYTKTHYLDFISINQSWNLNMVYKMHRNLIIFSG